MDSNDKSIFLASSSLYLLLLNESGIIATAQLVKPREAEEKFNELITRAAENYTETMSNIISTGDFFEIELLTNFSDFLNACIDIKKKELVEAENVAERLQAEAAEMEKNVSAHIVVENERAQKVARKSVK